MNKTGLYIHVPFCLSKCPYCDFYSVGYNENTAEEYTDSVIRNLRFYDREYDTVYFGGGTPILLYKQIGRIMSNIKHSSNAEITIEANPCCSPDEALGYLINSGVNRISFGIQSCNDIELKALGRRHTSAQAIDAVLRANKIGFNNISADLMLAIPSQTDETLEHSINILCSLPLKHISAYLLKIEPSTPFGKHPPVIQDEDTTDRLYVKTAKMLAENDFEQYEISNFAKKGYESKHNLKYWRCEEYIGIGPAAHSFIDGKRFAVKRNLGSFISDKTQNVYVTDENCGNFDEYLMLKLRLSEGITFEECDLFGTDRTTILNRTRLIPPEYLDINEKRIRITTEGFLLSNHIIGKLLGY